MNNSFELISKSAIEKKTILFDYFQCFYLLIFPMANLFYRKVRPMLQEYASKIDYIQYPMNINQVTKDKE